MLTFILRRLLSGVVLIAVISFLAFVLLYAGGGDIARRILGENATAETVAKKTEELGLNRPLLVQYGDWVASALTGNLGRSWFTGELVSVSVSGRLAVTLSLVLGATIVSAVLAVVLGVLAARRGGIVDGAVQFLSLVGFAVPGFLIALLLVLVFAINLGWFKATGYVPITTSPTGWLASVTLPVVALSLGAIATVAAQVRGSVIDAMSRDYVRTLRSRGLGMRSVIYKHVLRNAGGPALAVLAVQFVGLLGGAVVVEQIFAIPGMGQLSVRSTTLGDVPVVMGLVIAFAIIVVIVNLLIDLAQAALNPKVRLS
ncbi:MULTISPECIES: ABC transporter permease [Microbacterium]|jgi:peptide/nickel transport system permease protein|uniref:Peptide/nickel transport system permease protein n=2 Tax=Microbacterium TaxID=33882 RepID=A0ABU1I4D7_9MICO|nr:MULTISPECIES: ABC transporter permease [Microbacterium]APF34183.1 ABC transporter permease [Microbacterium paludicola]MDQ1218407.1 peptide/nickel transport system permease protein [Microbacterium arborescens]MDR6168496.1 peptide/nickel transport system permease protein [Microbacterium paludicola]OAZ40677.1 ABC transporter permease [Microbacterium arborescens]OWP20817.1 ABC transporter permease [Microbacterium sp. AISO3]